MQNNVDIYRKLMREFPYEKLQEITNLYNCNQQQAQICLIFLGLPFMGMTEDSAFMMEHGAMYVPYLMNGERYYTLITSMFLHFICDIRSLLLMNNMVMLLVIGYSLEPEIGKIRFLLIYLGSGLMGNLVYGRGLM